MVIVLGNLPHDVTEEDIKTLMKHCKPVKIEFFKNNSEKHSPYECMVTIDIFDPIIGTILEQHFNNMVWMGSRIKAHHLIFQ